MLSVIKIIVNKHLRRCASTLVSRRNDTGGNTGSRINSSSTIYALSSGQGKCGVAVVRISGNNALSALIKMTTLSLAPEPRKIYLKNIFDPETQDIIDRGLCIWFPGPKSFTGEDSVEFQVHGGPAILEALMLALRKLKFRPALPGEFTKRSFYNGKLDLTEIEGLADLIHAETEQQRKQALLQAGGSLSELYNKWRGMLLRTLANVEAYIDFSEDDNIEDNVLTDCNERIKKLLEDMSQHLADGRRGEILRNGVRTVIIGKPNVGKSSLLNYLVQRNAAIVTPIAGTTRDIVELNANIAGYPVVLADTAGLADSSSDVVEIEGIRRAREYAKTADFIILMIDARNFLDSRKSFDCYVRDYVEELGVEGLVLEGGGISRNCLCVVNKTDLIPGGIAEGLMKENAVPISCEKDNGISRLMEELKNNFEKICGNPSRENPTISQARHRIHMTNCVDYLSNYLELSEKQEYDMVIAGQQIRNAMREIGKVTGHVSTEEILDVIFTNFCIGK